MEKFSQFKNTNDQNLGIISECPLCKAKIIDLNIVEEGNNGYVIHSKCKKCQNSLLMIAVPNELGINVVGMNTDLSMDEFIKIRKSEKFISYDDVIEINKALGKKDFIRSLVNN